MGLRLDQLLARRVPELSRGMARRVLELGGVFVDRKRVKVARRQLRVAQLVEVHLGALLEQSAAAPNLSKPSNQSNYPDGSNQPGNAREGAAGEPFVVRWEDDDVIVVDKAAGILSAPTPESDRSNLQRWLTERLGRPVHLVHRLDRPTSGLILFAKTPRAAAHLGQALQQRLLSREYLLAVSGAVSFEQQEVSAPVRGKEARSTFWVVERRGQMATLLRARLATGRTHQLRVHAAHLGHPVLGDLRYGPRVSASASASASPRAVAPAASGPLDASLRPPRLALHAARLAFPHPAGGRAVEVESPWPDELATWWAALGALSTSRGLRSDPAPDPSSGS